MKLKVLHIAVHLGGGVGTVLRNWIKNDSINNHTVLLLNHNYQGTKQDNVYENMRNKYDDINSFVEDSDIVIVHFWNHPLLFEFLTNCDLPPCRVCVWSHVSALHPPYVHTNNLVKFSDKFILSSAISNIEDVDESFKDRTDVIWTTGGIDKYLQVKKKKTENFVVGYIGTLDYSKIHHNFIDICELIHDRIPNSIFTVCGSGGDFLSMKSEIDERGLSFINLVGMIDIMEVLPTFDVFVYPLSRTHFGTCEQVLGEVMACGIEPIVFDNPAEKYIVGDYGKVCSNISQIITGVESSYKNQITDSDMELLRQRAADLYSLDKMMDSWSVVFNDLVKTEKSPKKWGEEIGNDGFDIFVESVGKYGDILKYGNETEITNLLNSNSQWKSHCKGSVFQYVSIFKESEQLQNLLKYIS